MERDKFAAYPKRESSSLFMNTCQWYYDDKGYYHYLLLNGSLRVRNMVLELLQKNGVKVLRFNKSFRPASNGLQYDWYIRISDENRESIKNALSSCRVLTAKTADEKGIKREDYERLARQASVWKQYNIRHKKKIAELQKQLQEKYSEIEQLRSGIVLETSEMLELYKEENERLRKQTKDLEEFYGEEIERLEEEKRGLENQCSRLQYELASFAQKASVFTSESSVYVNSSDTFSVYRRTVEILLDGVELLHGSWDVLYKELPSDFIFKVWQHIKEIRERPDNWKKQWKKLHAAEDWYERHLGKQWRLYCSLRNNKIWVLISEKKEQEKDLIYLKNYQSGNLGVKSCGGEKRFAKER
ncbi:MAG TPA: hypothetical protein PKY88_00490 [Anaerohalosphaeraceae bacterium]|nr:hypothetical protein [Anaerohalosphaeraceae bacterium]